MGRKLKVLPEIKIKVVNEYLAGKRSVKQIAFELNVSEFSIEEWIRKYKVSGTDGLKSSNKNKYYSPTIKLKAAIGSIIFMIKFKVISKNKYVKKYLKDAQKFIDTDNYKVLI